MEPTAVLAERYVAENVERFLSAPVPIDPAFISDVEWLVGGWIVGKGLDAAYGRLKKRLGSGAYKARAKRVHPSVRQISGEGPEVTAVRIRELRPFLKIEPGVLLLMNRLAILYEGSPEGIFETAASPGVILSEVEIVDEDTKRGRHIKAAAKEAKGLFEGVTTTVVVSRAPAGTRSPVVRLVAGKTRFQTWAPRGHTPPPPP